MESFRCDICKATWGSNDFAYESNGLNICLLCSRKHKKNLFKCLYCKEIGRTGYNEYRAKDGFICRRCYYNELNTNQITAHK